MIYSDLNASGYGHSAAFYNAEFEGILSKIIQCYSRMISDGAQLDDDENSIRDYMLSNYLKKQEFKKEFSLKDYLFDKELSENTGRIDIRIMPINPFLNDEAYYVIECKRLNGVNQDGTSGLNAHYISNGIVRFTSLKYSSYHRTNGMIGFIVAPIDIHQNVISINALLTKHFSHVSTTQQLTMRQIASGFDFSYSSIHNVESNLITLYHLMLDFSKNIKL